MPSESFCLLQAWNLGQHLERNFEHLLKYQEFLQKERWLISLVPSTVSKTLCTKHSWPCQTDSFYLCKGNIHPHHPCEVPKGKSSEIIRFLGTLQVTNHCIGHAEGLNRQGKDQVKLHWGHCWRETSCLKSQVEEEPSHQTDFSSRRMGILPLSERAVNKTKPATTKSGGKATSCCYFLHFQFSLDPGYENSILKCELLRDYHLSIIIL